MELKFEKSLCKYLNCVISQGQVQEQTQELRLGDGMPDIGRILACWGQPMLRGKEWNSDSIRISGGIMAWVLYQPEDGSEPRSVDCWIPFQMKWEIPESDQDGSIFVRLNLRNLDARSTSARKMIVRGNLSAHLEAMEPGEREVYNPENPPEDLQLLKNLYPADLLQEYGEKGFQIDEELTLPEGTAAPRKLICYCVTPEMLEQKVLSSRLVFRGKANLHLLYAGEDGEVHPYDTELSFSQFADLEGEYSTRADCEVLPLVTGAEVNLDEEGRIQVKLGLAGQFLISDKVMLTVVEDAYSTKRQVTPLAQPLELPMRLERMEQNLRYSQELRGQGKSVLDTTVLWDQPQWSREGDDTQVRLPAQCQVLYRDENGSLQSANQRFEQTFRLPAADGTYYRIGIKGGERPRCTASGEQLTLTGNVELEVQTYCDQAIPMVTGVQMEEDRKADPNRASLVLRRMGDLRLWDLAKLCGSTVEEIRAVNGLEGDPAPDKMLLIPVK